MVKVGDTVTGVDVVTDGQVTGEVAHVVREYITSTGKRVGQYELPDGRILRVQH